MSKNVEIRHLETLAEMQAAEKLQLTIWDMGDLEAVSSHTMHALQFNGGALLGAFEEDQLVGFCLAVPGLIDSPERIDQVAAARLKLFSVILGVQKAYQDRGIGYELKLAQREYAMATGIRLITWTFDPLESRNARFNVGKLGVISKRYLRDFHGDMGGINSGLDTDRVEAEWWVTSNRVEGRVVKQRRPLSLDALLGGGALLVNEANFDGQKLPSPPTNYTRQSNNLILVEIPHDFQTIKKENMDLARQWRRHTRELFEDLFEHKYLITDFVTNDDDDGRLRSFYLFTHQDS